MGHVLCKTAQKIVQIVDAASSVVYTHMKSQHQQLKSAAQWRLNLLILYLISLSICCVFCTLHSDMSTKEAFHKSPFFFVNFIFHNEVKFVNLIVKYTLPGWNCFLFLPLFIPYFTWHFLMIWNISTTFDPRNRVNVSWFVLEVTYLAVKALWLKLNTCVLQKFYLQTCDQTRFKRTLCAEVLWWRLPLSYQRKTPLGYFLWVTPSVTLRHVQRCLV